MTLERVLLDRVPPHAPTHVELHAPDGRVTHVVVSIEHGRVYIMRYMYPYKGANVKVWSVYRWRGDEGEWLANRVPGETAFLTIQAAADAEPIVVDWTQS